MTGYVPPCSPLPRRRHNDLTDSPKTTYGETQHDTNAAWRAPMAQRRSRLDQLDRVMTLPWAEYTYRWLKIRRRDSIPQTSLEPIEPEEVRKC